MALELLRGTITNYKCTRDYANFVFDDSDKTKFGAIAIAAGLVGLGELGVVELGHFDARHEGTELLRRLENRNRAGRNFHR